MAFLLSDSTWILHLNWGNFQRKVAVKYSRRILPATGSYWKPCKVEQYFSPTVVRAFYHKKCETHILWTWSSQLVSQQKHKNYTGIILFYYVVCITGPLQTSLWTSWTRDIWEHWVWMASVFLLSSFGWPF